MEGQAVIISTRLYTVTLVLVAPHLRALDEAAARIEANLRDELSSQEPTVGARVLRAELKRES